MAASNVLFGVVFGAAVVAGIVLLVLTLRFVISRMRDSRQAWLQNSEPPTNPNETPDEGLEMTPGQRQTSLPPINSELPSPETQPEPGT